MPLKNRSLPIAAKEAIFRSTPNHMLMKYLIKKPLVFPLNKTFVNDTLSEENSTSLEQLEKKRDAPSGFHFPIGQTEKLPFHIARTNQGSLPVYVDYKKGRSQTVTLLRKVSGDKEALRAELMKILEQDVEYKPSGLLIKGHHMRMLRLYFRALGF